LALWIDMKFNDSFKIILDQLNHHRTECLSQVVIALMKFHNNDEAKEYVFIWITGNDLELFEKSRNILLTLAWTGIPKLSENDLLDKIKLENRNTDQFDQTIIQLKQILNIKIHTK
jgi:hypothetical protein